MPHILTHNPTINPPCSVSRSPTPFCLLASVRLRRPQPLRTATLSTSICNSKCKIRTIISMANPRRVKMVAKQIRREISDMLLTDTVLQYAVLPEAALGADRYLSSLTTISDVEVSADLQVVKVYVSVFGDERGKEVALAGLKSKAKYVRSALGKRMKLRLTPEVRFIEDESLERGSRVISILDRLKDENNTKATDDEGDGSQESADGINDEWDGDDLDDEGIIYVK